MDLEHVAGRLFIRVKNKATAAVKGIAKAPKGKRLSIDEMKPFAAKARKFAYASDEAGQELGALADAAKGAAHRAGTAIDDAMVSIAASNKRIAGVEAAAAKSSRAPLHQSFQPVKSQI